jgi:hypothetical protein
VEPLYIESSIIDVHNALTSNIILENILSPLENPSPLKDPSPHVCVVIDCALKKTRKILKSMI